MTSADATGTSFASWVEHFESNRVVQVAMEREIDWDTPCELPEPVKAALVKSFQRFELGENGDGARLLAKAEQAGDAVYLDALRRLVVEEQRHSELFRRGLGHLGAPTLSAHWSDAVFTHLRRLLGLRTELALFLVAESVAMGYFTALRSSAPDPVIRSIGRRVEFDELNHLRFQIDRLRQGFASTPGAVRVVVGLAWGVVAAGAATVLVVDHAGALRACGLRPAAFWLTATRTFAASARQVLGRRGAFLGPAKLVVRPALDPIEEQPPQSGRRV
jgi:hypothetical protein